MSEVTKAKFDKAAQIINSLPKDGPVKPTETDLLFFYKYFKQATIGDVKSSIPAIWDLTGRAKWNAWKEVEGTTPEVCYKKYVEKLIEFLKKAEYFDMIKELEAA